MRSLPLFLLSLVLLILPSLSFAIGEGNNGTEEEVYVSGINYTLEQPIGNATTVASYGEYIQLLYGFLLGIIGIIAVVLIMFGGMRWISAAGNQQAISSAKEIIISAISGLVIGIMSYSILVFINPNFSGLDFAVLEIPIHSNASNLECGSGSILTENSGGKQCGQFASVSGSPTTVSAGELNGWITQYNTGNVDPIFLKAIFKHESAFCINANSHFQATDPASGELRDVIGACGIVQMIPPTAKAYAGSCGLSACANVDDKYYWDGDATAQACCNQLKADPKKAVCAGVSELNNLSKSPKTGGNLNLVAASYNGGYAAIAESNACPGQYVYECSANHDASITTSYLQTYNYVTNAIPESYEAICAGNTSEICEPVEHPTSSKEVAANYLCVDASLLTWATCNDSGQAKCSSGYVTPVPSCAGQRVSIEDGIVECRSLDYSSYDEDAVLPY